VVAFDLAKVGVRVQFPLLAPISKTHHLFDGFCRLYRYLST